MDNYDSTITQQKAPWVMIALKYGIIFGLVSGLVGVFIFMTDSFSNIWLSITIGLAVSITGIVLMHREYKRHNAGYMTYGQGLLSGITMSIIAGLISGLISYAYVEFVDPGVLDRMREVQISLLEKFGLPEDKMEEAIAKMEAENTASKQITGGLTSGLVGGLLLSLIISAFTKRTRPELE
jgi:predicted Co/Zn/Cd cation transporter (cation efflux family)